MLRLSAYPLHISSPKPHLPPWPSALPRLSIPYHNTTVIHRPTYLHSCQYDLPTDPFAHRIPSITRLSNKRVLVPCKLSRPSICINIISIYPRCHLLTCYSLTLRYFEPGRAVDSRSPEQQGILKQRER